MENTSQTKQHSNPAARLLEKIYGGLDMSWRNVILFAVGTAVLTTVFLVIPVFKNTSFERLGVTMEGWVFFAVIIMANCYKQEETVNAGFFEKIRQPLICAAKVFVFFLISQPLIYLFQVPFSQDGWGLFRYYPFWFKWTIATIPMAFIGWYINKKNWLSLVILFPVLSLLTVQYVDAFVFTFKHFPLRLVTAVFCLAQVLVYVYVFTPKLVQKLIGILIPLAVVVVIKIVTPFEMFSDAVLPDRITVTRNAIIEVADPEGITVSFSDMEDEDFGYDPILAVHVTKYLTTDMTITDGGNVYRYTLEVYEDEGGHSRIRITAKEHTIVYAGNAGDDVSDDGSSGE